MPTEVRLPQLGQTMEEGTIVDYMVKVGDEVKKGDCIFEVETDKATLEVESPTDGFVKHILADLGQTLHVGEAGLGGQTRSNHTAHAKAENNRTKNAPVKTRNTCLLSECKS